MRISRWTLPLAALLGTVGSAAADIYRWTDANGQVHFSDQSQAGSKAVAPAPLNTFKPVAQNPDFYASGEADVHFNYYQAYPIARRDLPRALFAASPISEDGARFLGSTHWQLDWHYTTRQEGGSCRVNSARAKVTVTYTLPQLGNEATLPADAVTAFNDFYAHLFEHEKGHAESGKMAAKELVAELDQLPAAADCASVDAAAKNLFSATVRKYNARDQAYDARTNHGVTQGANIRLYL